MASSAASFRDALLRAEAEHRRVERELAGVMVDWRRQQNVVIDQKHAIAVIEAAWRRRPTVECSIRGQRIADFTADRANQDANRRLVAIMSAELRRAEIELRYQRQRVAIRREMLAEAEERVRTFGRLRDEEIRRECRERERRQDDVLDEAATTRAIARRRHEQR